MSLNKRRIVFMGMAGIYSVIPLQALLDAGADVDAIIFPRLAGDTSGARWLPPTANQIQDQVKVLRPVQPNILSLAGDSKIPIMVVGKLDHGETLAEYQSLAPDLVVVACFPRLLPESWLAVPTIGCLNLHPSLLPAYRGPEPLFWQLRAGEMNTGVSLHFMDTGADTGDLVAQQKVPMAEGVTSMEADQLLAEAGAQLLIASLAETEITRTAQPKIGASYQPNPGEADCVIPSSWGVQRAFNFVRGADIWAPFLVEAEDGARVEFREALGYQLGAKGKKPFEPRGEEFLIQFADGVLTAR